MRRWILAIIIAAGCQFPPDQQTVDRLPPVQFPDPDEGLDDTGAESTGETSEGSTTGEPTGATETGETSEGSTTGAEESESSTGDPGEPEPMPEPEPPYNGPTCFGTDGERFAVLPEPGDVKITEWMRRSSGNAIAEGQWVEITNVSDHAVDMNGLTITSDPAGEPPTLGDTLIPWGNFPCQSVPPGGRFLLVSNGDPAVNGGVFGGFCQPHPAAEPWEAGQPCAWLGLPNSFGLSAWHIGIGSTLLDSISWPAWAIGQDIVGAAWSLDPVSDAWCLATWGYGPLGNLGTPGAANPPC